MATPRRSVRSAALKRPLFSPARGVDAATASASASASAGASTSASTRAAAAVSESSSSAQSAQRIFSPTRRVHFRARRGQQHQQSHHASPNARSSPAVHRLAKSKASPASAKGRPAKAQTATSTATATAKSKPKLYEVECIRAIRRVGGCSQSQSGEREYLLKWRGYAESECTWEPLSSLGSGCMELLREFEASLQTKQQKRVGGRLNGGRIAVADGGDDDDDDDACANPWREDEVNALFQSYARTAPTTKGFWAHVAKCTTRVFVQITLSFALASLISVAVCVSCSAVAARSANECQEKYEQQFERVERECAFDADAENATHHNESDAAAPAESGFAPHCRFVLSVYPDLIVYTRWDAHLCLNQTRSRRSCSNFRVPRRSSALP